MNQTALYQILTQWINGADCIPYRNYITDRNIPLIKINPGGKDKVARLEIQQPKFQRGEVHLKPHHMATRDQLTAMPFATFDDRADACIYFLERSTQLQGSNKTDDTVDDEGGTIMGNVWSKKF
jgi:hypothetical protein